MTKQTTVEATYRHCVWRADNRTSGGIQLTSRAHKDQADASLFATARRAAAAVGITLAGGRLVICLDVTEEQTA